MTQPAEHAAPPLAWYSFVPLRNALLAALLAGVVFGLERGGIISREIAIAGFVAAILLGGWHWAREGLEDLVRERTVGIEILMLAATIGAAVLGMWDEAAALVVLYGAAEGLEEYVYFRTRASIRSLLDLAPKEAHVIREGAELTIPASELNAGDRFVVRPGETIVTDGDVIDGRSSVNEAPVTGESVPVEKQPGSKVFAGTLNTEGALTISATAAFADNTLSRIIHLVEQAQDEKGKAQQWIERFGKRYSPAVLGVAALMLTIPWFAGLDIEFWAQRAVVLLVAAAPCALIMSMPMAMASGIGAAGKRGILIKGGAHLEHLGKISIVAFDKTGTLTVGKPAVTDVFPVGLTRDELLAAAAGVEHFSQHPLAQAIVTAADTAKLARATATDFQSITGGGARANLDGKSWVIGSPKLMREQSIPIDAQEAQIAQLQEQGKTVVVVATGGRAVGIIAMEDQLRAEAADVVRTLHHRGIRTVMLTGDNARTAETFAKRLGIDEVRADLKPEQKVEAIKDLQRDGHVLMVGDGVNDAPALASATCGAAMGGAGTDAAIEAADVALMADDLSNLPVALAFGTKARRVSTQNIVLSIAVLVAMIPLALTGLLGIAATVLIHEAAELLAVANGLRAGRVSKR